MVSLIGTWENQLGSHLIIENVTPLNSDEDSKKMGSFFGRYHTAVSSSGQSLQGTCHGTFREASNCILISWSVQWQQTKANGKVKFSVSSWSGQVFDESTIETMWLLTSDTDRQSTWRAQNTGKDSFKKVE